MRTACPDLNSFALFTVRTYELKEQLRALVEEQRERIVAAVAAANADEMSDVNKMYTAIGEKLVEEPTTSEELTALQVGSKLSQGGKL